MFTRMIPAFAVAYWSSTHSAQLGAQMPTRSPASMPAAISPRARARVSWWGYCQDRDAGGRSRSPAPGVIMESWIAWLVLAALLGLAEIMTTTLAFGLLAVAAVVAAVVGAAGFGLPFQLVAFVLGAGAGLGIVRPLAVRHLRQPPLLKTGTSALVGR